MKHLIFTTIFTGIIILAGCETDLTLESTLTLNDTVELANFETLYNFEKNISLRMDSVLNDSRCPANVECVWEGNAEVRFFFTADGVHTDFTLNTHAGGPFNSDTMIHGYEIQLLELLPYPEDPGEILQVEYQSKVLLYSD